MKTPFSAEQQKAIYTKGNVIVSAGAGSGKTTVMVERIVEKLLAGNKLDKMLIVTFTRASAADIRVKLAERLTRLKRENAYDEQKRAIASEALEALPVCNIGTLHSFCQKLIRNYYYAAEVDPAAALADDGETKTLKLECIRRAVRAARDGGDKITCAVLDALSGRRDDEGAVGAVEDVIDFALSLSDARGYLSHVDDDEKFYAELDRITEARRDALKAEAELIKNEAAALQFKTLYDAACELDGYLRFGFELSRIQYRGKDQECIALYERFKELKGECKAFRADLVDIETAKTVESAPYARAICAIAIDALDRYEARKAALGRIDYADLEHGALKVLSDPDCMREIAKSIDFVFIDEYQDVNPLQAEIASLLKNSAGAEMFLVGDIKQSIYAFRRCNPVFFKNALSDPDYTQVLLNRNYRSSTEVIDFVNKVFTGVMSDKFGGADYNVDRLICGNPSHGAAEFYVASEDCAKKEKTETGNAQKTAAQPYSVMNATKGVEREDEQARLIVDLILDYADGGAGFGSVAVLVRSARTPFCDGLVRLMRANGIPCNLGRKSKVSDYPEAEALLRIARCVDNRFDDVALYTALRSPMGGFGDDELLEIATTGEVLAAKAGVEPESGFGTGRKSYCFWQKARAYKGEYLARLKSFFARRDALAEFARSHDAADALGRLTSEIDYFQYVFENGGNASAVESLISLAAAKKCSLSTFLVGADDAELNVGDGGDAVAITTIHASKGLEYDFVIVADIGRRFNMRDASNKCMTAGGGVAVKYPDEKTRSLKCSARWLLERYAVPDKTRAEELRLFYVALTRAKKRLVVCGRSSGTSHEPTAATCEYDFMKNVAARRVELALRESKQQRAELPIDRAIVDEVKARMTDGYKVKDVPIKTCVTAIAERSDDNTYFAPILTYDDRAANEEDDEYRKLDIGNIVGADAARRGTAYHRAMELIDFSSPDVEAVKRNMDDHELVDFDAVLAAAAEMKKLTDGARAYFKERYFIADMTLDGENTLVQGVIDLLIINADGTATIVDYKTTDPKYLLSDNYLKQLSLYAAAVEKSSPLKVASTYLYSFVLGKSIKCNRQ